MSKLWLFISTYRVMIHIVAQCHEEGLEHYLRSYVKVSNITYFWRTFSVPDFIALKSTPYHSAKCQDVFFVLFFCSWFLTHRSSSFCLLSVEAYGCFISVRQCLSVCSTYLWPMLTQPLVKQCTRSWPKPWPPS